MKTKSVRLLDEYKEICEKDKKKFDYSEYTNWQEDEIHSLRKRLRESVMYGMESEKAQYDLMELLNKKTDYRGTRPNEGAIKLILDEIYNLHNYYFVYDGIVIMQVDKLKKFLHAESNYDKDLSQENAMLKEKLAIIKNALG